MVDPFEHRKRLWRTACRLVLAGVTSGLAHLGMAAACFIPWTPELWAQYAGKSPDPPGHGRPLTPAEERAWARLVEQLRVFVISEEDQQ